MAFLPPWHISDEPEQVDQPEAQQGEQGQSPSGDTEMTSVGSESSAESVIYMGAQQTNAPVAGGLHQAHHQAPDHHAQAPATGHGPNIASAQGPAFVPPPLPPPQTRGPFTLNSNFVNGDLYPFLHLTNHSDEGSGTVAEGVWEEHVREADLMVTALQEYQRNPQVFMDTYRAHTVDGATTSRLHSTLARRNTEFTIRLMCLLSGSDRNLSVMPDNFHQDALLIRGDAQWINDRLVLTRRAVPHHNAEDTPTGPWLDPVEPEHRPHENVTPLEAGVQQPMMAQPVPHRQDVAPALHQHLGLGSPAASAQPSALDSQGYPASAQGFGIPGSFPGLGALGMSGHAQGHGAGPSSGPLQPSATAQPLNPFPDGFLLSDRPVAMVQSRVAWLMRAIQALPAALSTRIELEFQQLVQHYSIGDFNEMVMAADRVRRILIEAGAQHRQLLMEYLRFIRESTVVRDGLSEL